MTSLFRAGFALAIAIAVASAVGPAATGPAAAHEYRAGTLVIHHPWTRATPAGARVAGGFASIDNTGAEPDKLVGASLSRAETSEIHQMAMQGEVMTMTPVEGGIAIPAGGNLTLSPGGYHLMFPGLKAPLKQGEKVAGSLIFEKAGTVPVEFAVESIAAKGGEHDHTQ
jgi:periplasmic copper chaperone A